ncbi:MAG TPA: phosphatidylglycerophosphatase A [Vicinamibacteria bacterium]|nr:phosphatidylglycerophosphatase A [Vicinamibacteria bacterium]
MRAGLSPTPIPRRADVVSTALATALWSGYFPIAPGTVGSAVGVVSFLPLLWLPAGVQLAAVAGLFLAGVVASGRVARGVGLEDPGIVVVDEVLGMWTSLLFLPFTPGTVLAAFLLFRVLDVFKPYPARQLESLPGGWGIMSDDLMAGLYANLLLRAGHLALGP